MSGDYSRQRFDPQRDFSGVLMQQGRVQLDADWNEQVELADRRWRAETSDLGPLRRAASHAERIQDRSGRRRQIHDRPRAHLRGRFAGRESRRRGV